MKLITFEIETPLGPVRRVGALWDQPEGGGEERAVDLALAFAARLRAEGDEPRYREYADFRLPQDMCALIAGGEPSLDAARRAIEYVAEGGEGAEGPSGERIVHPPAQVRLLAPVPRPASFRDFLTFERHRADAARRRGEEIDPLWYEMPTCYKGNRLTIIGPGEDLRWPRYTEKFDYELELGMFIGKPGRDIAEADAMDHVFGFSVLNDFSARDIQMEEMSLWARPPQGKRLRLGPRPLSGHKGRVQPGGRPDDGPGERRGVEPGQRGGDALLLEQADRLRPRRRRSCSRASFSARERWGRGAGPTSTGGSSPATSSSSKSKASASCETGW